MTYALRRYRPAFRVLIVSISAAVLGALAWVGVYGDGHQPPVREPWGYREVHVCPSAAWVLPALVEATNGYASACVPLLPVRASRCEGPPADGVAQVRDHRDQVVGWTADVGGPFIDRIAHRELAAVAYVLEEHEVRSCTPAHVLGHLLGFRQHATAATSVMADPCGPSFEHLSVCDR
ncbi:MAG: hypothetical protein H6736_17130 [Alphaproteobacteria bacterium]|nr:hypothetical protein [Alphaproteobacteria bacterium]